MRTLPKVIQDVGFDFQWDERKVWQLDVPVERVPIDSLIWHFQVPFLSTPTGFYDLTPQAILDQPEAHPEQYARVKDANTSYPVDIMFWRGKWLILDGLHRLMKLAQAGEPTVRVRKIPETCIPLILKKTKH